MDAGGLYDAVQTDAYYIGLTANWYMARNAHFYNTKLVPHNWSSSLNTAANAHLVAGTPSGYMCEFFMYPNEFRYGLLKEPHKPVNGYIELRDKPGFGMELVADPGKRFPYEPGPNTIANPRYPHAWERARKREEAVRRQYVG